MDTVGLLARDLKGLTELAAVTTKSPLQTERISSSPDWKTVRLKLICFASALLSSLQSGIQILYPTDFFPHSNPEQQRLVDDFVTDLETILDVKKTEFSIAERWKKCPPPEAEGREIQEYINKVPSTRHSDIWELTRINRLPITHFTTTVIMNSRSSGRITKRDLTGQCM